MPRRSNSLPVPPRNVTGTFSAPVVLQEQATRLLTQAHQLLANVAEEGQALEQCLVVLQHAPAEACFFYRTEPPALVPAVSRRAGGRTVTTVRAQLTAALQQIPARIETIRLNTLFTLSRLGVPVALWHFLIPGPLPISVTALAPTGAADSGQTGHPPPRRELLSTSLFVPPIA
jgi:hypothetical protein